MNNMANFHEIALYMDDTLREQVHAELVPCSPKEFLARYLELDPSFQDLLDTEFSEAYLEAALLDRDYYFPNSDAEDSFFNGQEPVCVDLEELAELAIGWGIPLEDLMQQVHLADPDEISIYGISER